MLNVDFFTTINRDEKIKKGLPFIFEQGIHHRIFNILFIFHRISPYVLVSENNETFIIVFPKTILRYSKNVFLDSI